LSPVLDDVRELMSEELMIALEVVTREHDVRSPCIRARAERIGGGRSALVAVNAHATEVVTEALLHVLTQRWLQRSAGTGKGVIYTGGHRIHLSG
jgi:hypothetical protein